MIRQCLIMLFLFFSFISGSFSQNFSYDERLRQIVKEEGQAVVFIPYSDRKSIDFLTRNVSILTVRDGRIEISLSRLTVDWFIFQKYDYLISERIQTRGIKSAVNLDQAMEWDTYPTWNQYDSIMQGFKVNYPSLCKLDTIGKSINGKVILALKLSDNAITDEDEPEVFYTSTIHGDETGGFVLMLRFADYLLRNYTLNDRIKKLLDNLEIWINPLANPDGTYRSGNTISSPIRYNANGYDLNRNFPDPVLPNPPRQKETLDMMNFLGKHRFVISANFHSGEEVVNYPWDRWYSKLHADDSWFKNISRGYADTVHEFSNPAYMNGFDNGITRGAEWYVITGGRQDFVTRELQGREVTIELDESYVTPPAQLPLLWQNNRQSLIGYLENALFGIHGKVINENSSDPVASKVYISGHDKDSSHIYSDTLSGSFVRLLSPGSWDLTFSAKGYRDTLIKNVIVLLNQKTDIVVKMKPVSNIDTIIPAGTVLYPNPASAEIKALLPDQLEGTINVRIYSQTGILWSDYDAIAQKGTPLIISINELPPGVYTVIFRNKLIGSAKGRFVVIN